MEVYCQCDWGLGITVPHLHRRTEWVRKDDRTFWVPAPCVALNPDMELLATWDWIEVHVDWTRLYKEATMAGSGVEQSG